MIDTYPPCFRLLSLRTKRLILFCFILISMLPLKSWSIDEVDEKEAVKSYFEQVITTIDTTLFENKLTLRNNTTALVKFVDSKLLPYWDAELTLKLLIGGKRWKNLSPQEISSLNLRFNQTLHRYVREGMKHYDGQRIKLLRVKLNKKQTRGLVTLELEPIYLPAFNMDFKIARRAGQWQLYDVMIEGISYVKMKKNEYRQLLSEKGFNGLVVYLDHKNGFFPAKKSAIHNSSVSTTSNLDDIKSCVATNC